MISHEYCDEIPLGVECAWPALLITPSLASVPPLHGDSDNAYRASAPLMEVDRSAIVITSL